MQTLSPEQKKVLRIAKQLHAKYANDFEGWVNDNISFAGLKLSGITPQQREIAHAIARDRNVCVSAGGGIGKTAFAALTILWFLSSFPYSKIPTTAPSAKQLYDVLWSEIALWLNRCKLKNLFRMTKGKLAIKGFDEWYAVARTVPKDGKNLNDTLAGFHAASGYLLNVVDEACFDTATEILTAHGWRSIDTIQETDKALTKPVDGGYAYYAPIQHIHRYDHDGDMYVYEYHNCDFKLTPNHRVFCRNGYGWPFKQEMQDFKDGDILYMDGDFHGHSDIVVPFSDVRKEHYKGRVWCVTVPPHELIYVRRNGKCMWTCNSGVPDPVFTALEGAMTDENSYILLISNPVSFGGYYYDTISDPEGKGKDYKVLYFKSTDSPLVDESYAQRIINRYGKDSPMYQAKVLGKPVSAAENVVCSPEAFDAIIKNNKTHFSGPIVMGVDIGGGGDKTVFCHREAMSIIRWDEFSTTDPDDIVSHALELYERLYRGRPFTCVVDAGGIGWGPFHSLQKKAPFPVVGFLGQEKANEPTMYKNKRTEGYHILQRELPNLHFPTPPPGRLKKELANLCFNLADEPITMEEKRKFRKRLGFSPDYADALMMTIDVSSLLALGSYKITKQVTKAMTRLNIIKRADKFGKYSKFVM